MVGAAVVMEAVVVVVVNKGNEDRPGGERRERKRDVESREFWCETTDHLMS